MSALVVFESMYGNTRDIAEAVAEGLRTRTSVTVAEVASAPRAVPADVDLIVVGGPTHAHGMSRPGTRASAARTASTPVISAYVGVREWLGDLVPPGRPVAAAAFDTRLSKPRWLTGSAARGIARKLRKAGFQVRQENSFVVAGAEGPLDGSEKDRARAWGARVADLAGASNAPAAG
jgi:hypothetical protein